MKWIYFLQTLCIVFSHENHKFAQYCLRGIREMFLSSDDFVLSPNTITMTLEKFCMFNPVLWHRITARCNIISTKYFVALLVHIMSYWENSKTNQDLKLIRRVQREKRDCCNGISSLQRMLKKIWAYSILASLSSNFDAWNFSRLVQFYKCIVKGEKQSSYLCWGISFTTS